MQSLCARACTGEWPGWGSLQPQLQSLKPKLLALSLRFCGGSSKGALSQEAKLASYQHLFHWPPFTCSFSQPRRTYAAGIFIPVIPWENLSFGQASRKQEADLSLQQA